MTQSVYDNYTTKCSGGNDPVGVATENLERVFRSHGLETDESRGAGKLTFGQAAFMLLSVDLFTEEVATAYEKYYRAAADDCPLPDGESPFVSEEGLWAQIFQDIAEEGQALMSALSEEEKELLREKLEGWRKESASLREQAQALARAEAEKAPPGSLAKTLAHRVLLMGAPNALQAMERDLGCRVNRSIPVIIISASTTHARSKEYKAPSRRSSSSSGGGGDGGDDSGGSGDPEPPAATLCLATCSPFPLPHSVEPHHDTNPIVASSDRGWC